MTAFSEKNFNALLETLSLMKSQRDQAILILSETIELIGLRAPEIIIQQEPKLLALYESIKASQAKPTPAVQ